MRGLTLQEKYHSISESTHILRYHRGQFATSNLKKLDGLKDSHHNYD